MSLRIVGVSNEFSNAQPAAIPSEVEGSCGSVAGVIGGFLDSAEFTLSEQSESNGFARNKKPEPGCRFGFLDFYPTDAV
jgi:hypothetical protein